MTVLDPDLQAELEEERDGLLRSLDDLEAEREAGDLDEADYRNLRDGYTARAAEVLRALDGQRTARATAGAARRPRPRWQRPVAILVVAGLAVGAGLAVAGAAGSRPPGGVITGEDLEGNVDARLAEAADIADTEPLRSLEIYDEVIAEDAANVEAFAERGLLLASLSAGLDRPELLDGARASVDRALELDADDPRSRFYLGLVELFDGNRRAARRAFRSALAADPPPFLRQSIEQRLAALS